MKNFFILLFFLVVLLVGFTSYQVASSTSTPLIKPSTIDSIPSLKISSREFSRETFSQKWVSYGEAPQGELRGLLIVPEGPGPFPAIIFNHGSKHQPEPKRAVARFFIEQGYVVFLPHRRGYSNSDGPTLEEAVIDDIFSNEGKIQLLDRLEQEGEDVLKALSFIKHLSFVDSRSVVIAGYSFGGIATIMAASKSSDFVAGVVFATASGTWILGGLYRQGLINAVREARVPLFLIYAENDYDISPAIVFSRELRRMGKPGSLRIYPPFGQSEQDAHEIALRPEGIEIWGSDVMRFIERWMPSP